MALKTLLMGYTGRCFLGLSDGSSSGTSSSEESNQVFLTSYSLSINTNVIKSGAARRLMSKDNETNNIIFQRIALNVVRDCPVYEISLSFQLTPGVFNFLQEQLCNHYFRRPFKVNLQDQVNFSNGSMFQFDECYVTSFSLSVDSGAVAVVSLNLTYYDQVINFINNKVDIKDVIPWNSSSGSSAERYGGGDLLIPYYNWGIDYFKGNIELSSIESCFYKKQMKFEDEGGEGKKEEEGENKKDKILFNRNNIQNFSFNFQQSITPKYSLGKVVDSSSSEDTSIAKVPKKIIFSVPNMNYELSYIYGNSILNVDSFNDYINEEGENEKKDKGGNSNRIISNPVEGSSDKAGWYLMIRCITYNDYATVKVNNSEGKEKKKRYIGGFLLTKCYPDSYNPSLANSGSVNALSISGTIYGKINMIQMKQLKQDDQ